MNNMNKRANVFLLFISVIALTLQPAIASAQTAAPTVDASSNSQPMLLGVNYAQPFWQDSEKAVLGKLPLGIVRWGGNPSDFNGSLVPQVQRFVSEVRAIHNAEPLYQVPFLYSLPNDGAQQVRRVNIEAKLGIKYWEIGNEPELFQASHHDDTSLEDYLKQWRADAQAMLAVDPSIIMVGPDVSLKLTPLVKTSRDWQWFDAFIKTNGDLIKVVTFHFYPYGKEAITPDAVFANADEFAQSLATLRSYLHDTLKRDLPLMITEINLSYLGGSNTNTNPGGLFAGLWMADIIGISAQQGVAGIMPWTAVRNQGLSLVGDDGSLHPTYYAVQDFAGLGPKVNTPDGLPTGVHGYYSQNDSGESIEVLINRTNQPASYTVAGTTLSLKPYSLTRLHFDAGGKLDTGTTYSQTEFDANKPPSDALHSAS